LAGIQCTRCREAGHHCQAQIIVDEIALCLRCADDEPCAFAVAAASAKPVTIDPDPCVVPDPTPEDRKAIRAMPLPCFYKLDAKGRAQIVQLTRDGYGVDEIAHRLGLPRNTVKNAVAAYRHRKMTEPIETQVGQEVVSISPLAVFGPEMLEAADDLRKKKV
jgi:hypothetical protein